LDQGTLWRVISLSPSLPLPPLFPLSLSLPFPFPSLSLIGIINNFYLFFREGFVYQQYCPLVDYGGRRPIIGGWVIGGKAAGIGIREGRKSLFPSSSSLLFPPSLLPSLSDISAITGNTSFFCPHIVRPRSEFDTPLQHSVTQPRHYQLNELMTEQSHVELPFCAAKVPRICTIS
jgi:hypothetical protein